MHPTVITRPMAKFKIRSQCERCARFAVRDLREAGSGEVSHGQADRTIVPRERPAWLLGLAEWRHAKRTLRLPLGSSGARAATRNHRRQRRQYEHRWLSGDRRVV